MKAEYQKGTVYPPGNKIFNAFDHCSFDDVRVIILGQDPYHGKGQAIGLCIGVQQDCKFPPSLRNINKELISVTQRPPPPI